MAATRPACRCTAALACRPCQLLAVRLDYRLLWGVSREEADAIHARIGAIPRKAGPPVVDRIPLGEVAPCGRRGAGCPPPPGQSPLKTWYQCDAGFGVVCQCECGPACTRFVADGPATGSPATVTLTMGAGGIGDGVQGLMAVAAVRRAYPDAYLIYRAGGRAVPFVGLFDGYDELSATDAPPPADWGERRELNDGYAIEQNTRCVEPRVARYCRNAGVSAPRLPYLRDAAAARAAGAEFAGAVVLCPFSNGRSREYSVPGWVAVESRLMAAGVRTVVTHTKSHKCWAFRSQKVIGATPARVAGMFLNAAAVVANDSGMAHLAAILGTPTVVLEGPTRIDAVFAGYPNVTPVAGPLPCTGCHWGGLYNANQCTPRCPSLQGVDPARVAAATLEAMTLPAAARARTLFQDAKVLALRDAVRATVGLPGDLAEVGVYRGGSAALICKFAMGDTVRLFDTFEGLPADCPEGVHRRGEFAADEADVVGFLRSLGHRPVVHRGLFPATAPPGGRYRFVHVDGDLYETTRAAIAYFGPRMVPGGVMLFDDYRWPDTPGVTRAVDAAFPDARPVGENQALVRF